MCRRSKTIKSIDKNTNQRNSGSLTPLYRRFLVFCQNTRYRAANRFNGWWADERGLETVQVLIILLMIVVIAAVLGSVIKDFVAGLLVFIRGA